MFAHIYARRSGIERFIARSLQKRLVLLASLALIGLLASGCSNVPPAPLASSDPANPEARVPASSYTSAVGSYKSKRPVDPLPWREQNERIAPEAKP